MKRVVKRPTPYPLPTFFATVRSEAGRDESGAARAALPQAPPQMPKSRRAGQLPLLTAALARRYC